MADDSFDVLPTTPAIDPQMPGALPVAPAQPQGGGIDLASLPPELQAHLHESEMEDKYGSAGQMLKTAAEGAGQGVLGPIAPLIEKHLMGVDEKNILGRQETNPFSHGVGETAGVVGSMLTGVGEGALMGKAGALAAEHAAPFLAKATASLAPKIAAPLARVGSEVVKQGIENMVMSSGDEMAKMVLHDPGTSAENAIANVGLAGVLGGAFGGATKGTGELWAATAGPKLGSVLDALRGRANTGTAVELDPTKFMSAEAVAANREGQNAIIQGMEDTGNAHLESQKQVVDAVDRLSQANQGPDFIDRLNEGAKAADGTNLDKLKARGLAEGPTAMLRQAADVEIPASLEAALGDNSAAKTEHALFQSDSTKAGQTVRDDLAKFKTDLSRKAEETLGMAEGDIGGIANVSEKDIGAEIGKSMHGTYQDAIDTVVPEFEKFKAMAEHVAIQPESMAQLSQNIVERGIAEGWDKAPSSPEYRLWHRVQEELPLQKTAHDLAKYTTLINNETKKEQMWNAGRVLRGALRQGTDDVLEAGLGSEVGSKAVSDFRLARSNYGKLMDFLEETGDRIGVRSFNGPAGFMQEFESIASRPEKLLARLNTNKDANLGKVLDMQFPDVSAKLNAYGRTELARKSLNPDRQTLNIKALGKQIAALSPEYRDRLLSQAGTQRLNAIEELARRIPEPFNKSGTAGAIQNWLAKTSPSALGMAGGFLVGGLPGTGVSLALTKLGEYVGKEMPAAMRLAMLKNLASEAPTNPTAFKAMAEYIHNAIKGENAFAKASKAVFMTGGKVLIDSQLPDAKDRTKLDKMVGDLQNKPGVAMQDQADSPVGHYMPEQQSALTQASMTQLQYLQGLKPHPQRLSPLDREVPPAPAAIARYNRALDIAQQPLVVLNHIKEGTLQTSDLQDMKAMYPALYDRTVQKLSNDMINRHADDAQIPYQTRMSLSLFLGQPVDSSMQPLNIMAAQSVYQPQAPAQGPQQAPGGRVNAKAGTALDKGAKSYMTASQQAAADREGRK